jgi:DNA-binding transcriptional MerR regulator
LQTTGAPTGTQTLWTVGEVAELTRLSIRTLHHYDDLGLLRPSARSGANYRLYTPADLERLRRVLTWRDLGFSLADIARLLGAGAAEERRALELQATLLTEQLRQTRQKLSAVTSLLGAARREGAPMTREELKEMFGSFAHGQYEDEVQERWGDTEAYRQSRARTEKYTKADWAQLKAEMEAINARYVALMDAGVGPDSPQAAAAAEAQRSHFDRWYYDCSPQMLRNVSDLWVSDERFTRNIDRVRPGLAAYQHAAVQAWAAER